MSGIQGTLADIKLEDKQDDTDHSKRLKRRRELSLLSFEPTKRQLRPYFQPRYALTLGEQAEIRVGSTLVGSGLAKHGFSVDELKTIHSKLGVDLRVLSDALD